MSIEYGVQLYTLRKYLKTPAGVKDAFKRIKDMGMDIVQLSGVCDMPAQDLYNIASDNGLRIVATHSPYERMLDDLDKLAEEHLIYKCDTIGLGAMTAEYRRNNYEKLPEFVDNAYKIIDKLSAYGLKFAYHNHHFEFDAYEQGLVIDKLIEIPKLQIILDTYWVHFAGESNEEYIKRLHGRLENVHLKGYKKRFGAPLFSTVGSGEIDFVKLMPLFEQAGTKHALIEQDIALRPYHAVNKSWNYIKDNLIKK